MADLPKISDEMVELLARRLHRERYPDGERLDAHAAMAWDGYPGDEREPYRRRARAHLAALVASGWRPEGDVLREAYWKLRDHAEGYRSAELSRRVQERFRADPDNAVLSRAASRDRWYAGGIDVAARDLAELMGVPEHEIERATALEPAGALPVADGSGQSAAHERLACRHGWVVAQCKCLGPHADRVVDCPPNCDGLPPADPISEGETDRG